MDVNVGKFLRRDGVEDSQAIGACRRRGKLGNGVGHDREIGLEPLGKNPDSRERLAIRPFDADLRLTWRLEDDADRLFGPGQRRREPGGRQPESRLHNPEDRRLLGVMLTGQVGRPIEREPPPFARFPPRHDRRVTAREAGQDQFGSDDRARRPVRPPNP